MKFTPDNDLLKFADYFSSNFVSLESGYYLSKKEGYRINYIPFRELTRGPIGVKRVFKKVTNLKNESGKKKPIEVDYILIEIDRNFMVSNSISSDTVFYLIMWSVIHSDKRDDKKKCDTIALDYYNTTGRPRGRLIKDLKSIFVKNKENIESSLDSLSSFDISVHNRYSVERIKNIECKTKEKHD